MTDQVSPPSKQFFFLLGLGVLWISDEASATNPYVVCAQSIVALREHGHGTPSISRETTRVASDFLARFLDSQFPRTEFDHHPQSRPASATSSSGTNRKQAVARRISALLRESRGSENGNAPENGVPTFTILYAGSTIDGSAQPGEQSELIKYIQTLSAVEANLMSQPGAGSENFREHLVSFGIAPLVSSIMVYLWWLTFLDLKMLPVTALLSIAPYTLPEQFIRGAYHYRPRFSSEEAWLKNRLAQVQKYIWWYDSQDFILDRDAFHAVWSTGEASPDGMFRTFTNLLAPRTTKPKGAHPYIPRPLVHLQLDRLLTSDPKTGLPVYVVFLRAHEKRPLYPKPARQEITEEALARALTKAPAGK